MFKNTCLVLHIVIITIYKIPAVYCVLQLYPYTKIFKVYVLYSNSIIIITVLWRPGIRQPGSGEIREVNYYLYQSYLTLQCEYTTTNSSCYSGDPATNTMAYNYPPGLNCAKIVVIIINTFCKIFPVRRICPPPPHGLRSERFGLAPLNPFTPHNRGYK